MSAVAVLESVRNPSPGRGEPVGARASNDPLRGRDAELTVARTSLVEARTGTGSVLIVEGPSGSGRSRLLLELRRVAESLGHAVALRSPVQDASSPALTFATLLRRDLQRELGVAAVAARGDDFSHSDVAEQVLSIVDDLAPGNAVFVGIDDVERVDDATARLLSVLVRRSWDRAVMWALAVDPTRASSAAIQLLTELRAGGARVVELMPLRRGAVDDMIDDVVRARPSSALSELVDLVGGEPAAIAELVRDGLVEGTIRVDGATADLVTTRIPARTLQRARAALEAVSSPARHAALVAAVLGHPISLDDVASMLEVAPARLLGPFEELAAAGILRDHDSRWRFRHELLRRSVLESVPLSARQALGRQAIEIRLAAGRSPLIPAIDVAEAAEPGDHAVVRALTAAVRALAATDAGSALEIGRRAFDLTVAGDDGRGALAADLVRVMAATGRATDGQAIAEDVLAESPRGADDALVLLSVAELAELPAPERISAGRRGLALPAIPPPVQVRLRAATAAGLIEEGRSEEADDVLGDPEATATSGETIEAALLAGTGALIALRRGELRAASDRLSDVESTLAVAGAVGRPGRLLHAELRFALDDVEGARRVAFDALSAARRHGRVADAAAWNGLLGRVLAQVGPLDQAMAALTAQEPGVSFELTSVAAVDAAATLAATAHVALHQGDAGRLREVQRIADHNVMSDSSEVRRHLAWVHALSALSADDADRAAAWFDDGSASPLAARADVLDHPVLVRLALLGGRHVLARQIAHDAAARSGRNPGALALAAAAAHAAGLVDADESALQQAVDLLQRTPRQLALASAIEDLGTLDLRNRRQAEGIRRLNEALERYAAVGAHWDAARVRRRLRRVGVRRRLTTPARPSSGWSGLTPAELAVVELIAAGLTNRAAADRLYLSPHTVSMHLRHVFTKLGISSRVELARIVAPHRVPT